MTVFIPGEYIDVDKHYRLFYFILFYRRIKTFLPKQKRLWDESSGSQASVANREKLDEFEKEQEVW